MRGLAVVLCLGLGACAADIPTTPLALDDAHTSVAIAGIKSQLKDPDSAKFSAMRASRSVKTGNVRVCGLVNAKNSYGGYTGDLPFFADLSDAGGNVTFIRGLPGSPKVHSYDFEIVDSFCQVAHI